MRGTAERRVQGLKAYLRAAVSSATATDAAERCADTPGGKSMAHLWLEPQAKSWLWSRDAAPCRHQAGQTGCTQALTGQDAT